MQESSGALMKLSEPVDYDAPDGDSVDLIFGLILPKELNDSDYGSIGMITALLTNDSLIAGLRSASRSSELYDALFAGQLPAGTAPKSVQTI
jgi:PTS system nitrogen regulatory IIA component